MILKLFYSEKVKKGGEGEPTEKSSWLKAYKSIISKRDNIRNIWHMINDQLLVMGDINVELKHLKGNKIIGIYTMVTGMTMGKEHKFW